MAANMSAGKLGSPDSSDAPPTPLEARSVHTTRIIESHLTWVAKQNRHRQNSRSLMESSPPDIGVALQSLIFPNFSLVKAFSVPRARSFPAMESRHLLSFPSMYRSQTRRTPLLNTRPNIPCDRCSGALRTTRNVWR